VKSVTCNLPDSLYKALGERMETDNANCDHVMSMALSQYLRKPIHTLFQVSTSAALVEGLYQGAVQVSRLLGHGDFGLGMFIDLDGEMVVLDGVCYQVSSTSAVAKVEGDRLIPYPVVTGFKAGFSKQINPLDSYSKLGFCLRGYSGEGEHRFRREAERHSGAKVNSSRSVATLVW